MKQRDQGNRYCMDMVLKVPVYGTYWNCIITMSKS